MRKIISKKEQEKKEKRRNLIGGIVLVIVMLFSTIGYSLLSKESESIEKINYEGKNFIKQNGLWTTQIGDFSFSFVYSPQETFIFNSQVDYLNEYVNLPLYIYSEDQNAINEVYRNLFYDNSIVQRAQLACLEGEACEGDYPIKNCSDKLIVIRESNLSSLKQQDNCVFIEGKSENLVKLTDSFLLKITGLQ